jgi:hypothetical protein
LCPVHKAELERGTFFDVDIEKVNAATRAQKEVTYKTYYNSEDDPSRKPVMKMEFNRHWDSQGRQTITAGKIHAESIQSKFVRDPYSEKMRLKDEISQMVKHVDGLSRQMQPDHNGNFVVSTYTAERYTKALTRLKELSEEYHQLIKPQPSIEYVDHDNAVKAYRDMYLDKRDTYEVYGGDSNIPIRRFRA